MSHATSKQFITYSSYASHTTSISSSKSHRESRISAHSGLSSIMARHCGLALRAFSMSAMTQGALRGRRCASFHSISHSGDGLTVNSGSILDSTPSHTAISQVAISTKRVDNRGVRIMN
ncbi:hypothetical protein M758_UG113800 [Ceratodon purpureus]|nr:hypothetical protein M758_UG113800 [Ceratodon purpureus]